MRFVSGTPRPDMAQPLIDTDTDFDLVACDASGRPSRPIDGQTEQLIEACKGTAGLYREIGFYPPWIGYVAARNNRAVGGGAFVGAPAEGRVEIAYYTLDGLEGQGHALSTARALVELAHREDPQVVIIAKTLPEENASTRILHGLGFTRAGIVQDDEVGEAWLWELPPVPAAAM